MLLAFAGVKLVLAETPVGKLPVPVTLGVIAVTIGVSIAWSMWATRGGTGERGSPSAAPPAPAPPASRS